MSIFDDNRDDRTTQTMVDNHVASFRVQLGRELARLQREFFKDVQDTTRGAINAVVTHATGLEWSAGKWRVGGWNARTNKLVETAKAVSEEMARGIAQVAAHEQLDEEDTRRAQELVREVYRRELRRQLEDAARRAAYTDAARFVEEQQLSDVFGLLAKLREVADDLSDGSEAPTPENDES